MKNIKLTIMYDGSRFLGWQRLGSEHGEKSIQDILEQNISKLLGEAIKIIGSGRTDTGVHAFAQIANFHTRSTMGLEDIFRTLNHSLPEGISITDIEEVQKEFHSRYDAKSKTYEYHIDTREVANVFTRKYALHEPFSYDINAMKEASRYLIGEHDFQAFASRMNDDRTTIRIIESIDIDKEEDEIRISIKGNGFLYHMVRIMVGTLILVGKGKMKPEDIKRILESRNRKNAGPTVSSVGLFLKRVEY
ncbi:tRNA pseudouridine(38-40) synthase TruA [Anaeromicropila herbilytica]|uniref:tRNA pseudouridine synthase A n=1 Tax=Anaeromicropila herbilytica TaxID=2785025 RepID=A0A7R7EHQ9_9FIRM|nr:tRNA pseudouridine(38-40) synthase TruA [Anaeromicropila herbilytica]BCN28977.1 tRNA pseudouridine synthase A [Anaeromicropila herbilytica]